MAITLITQPNDFGRVYDTNRLMYKMSSTNANLANFRFYIKVYVGDITENPVFFTPVGIVRKRPLGDGTCFFNPAEIWSNYLTHDLEIDVDSLKECLNSNTQFKITITEEYGEPPELNSASLTSSDVITLYNGLQEYIPYDITEYGGGNNQWVMAPVDVVFGFTEAGTWNNVDTWVTADSETDILINSDDYNTGIERFLISLNDLDPTTSYNNYINTISVGEKVLIESTTTGEYLIITFDIQYSRDAPTGVSGKGTVSWFDINIIAISSGLTKFSDGEKLKISWLELNDTEGQGKFLTDATDFRVDEKDYSNLYFISDKNSRPETARVEVYYWVDHALPAPGGGGSEMKNYVVNSDKITSHINIADSAPNPTRGFQPPDPTDSPGMPEKPVFQYYIASYITGFTLDYTTTNNQMYYIPTGPVELDKMGLFDFASPRGGWVSYKINLIDGLLKDPTKIYNKYPMYYYKQDKCDKYDAMQLFWLNPHGGFDRYTFYKKNYISYDLERTTWEHRFSDTYVLGERGTTVYKTKTKKNIELNTDWLSASEAQTLGQMMMSPEVYTVYEYDGNVYKIPYVINDGSFDYKEKKNEKMVSMKINITPAWSRTSQTS